MIEILPINSLREEDSLVFGSLNVYLSKLSVSGLPIVHGVVVTSPQFKLKTSLEHLDFGSKEVFEQNLTIFKKELENIPIPENLIKELKDHKNFLLSEKILTSVTEVWRGLIDIWIDQIRKRLWKEGFGKGVTENLDPQKIIFINKPVSFGSAYIDQTDDEVVIEIKVGELSPQNKKTLDEIIQKANKKLLLPFIYEWILDGSILIKSLAQYTPSKNKPYLISDLKPEKEIKKPLTTVRSYLDLSIGLTYEKGVDGVYIESERIVNLNNLHDSMEDIIFRLVESASAFPDSPVLLKLADIPEDRGGMRGSLRLLHQQNLLNMLTDATLFSRYKYVKPNGVKGFNNIHLVIPFVRTPYELLEMKRELAVRKILRKNSFEIWMEASIPENIINIEDYIATGIDGVVINLDELIAFFGGFDHTNEQISFYKKEVSGLIKLLKPALKELHKSKLKFICTGSLSFDAKVLEFLVESGVHGIVVQRYEASSINSLLHQVEKRLILARSNP